MDTEQPQIGRLLKQITETLKRQANNDMRPQDVTMSQMHVLMELHRNDLGTASFKELETKLGVAQSTIWGLVDRLRAKGLVECICNQTDRRAKAVRITPAGTKVCENCHKDIIRRERQMTSNLSREEVAVLADLLERVHKGIAED